MKQVFHIFFKSNPHVSYRRIGSCVDRRSLNFKSPDEAGGRIASRSAIDRDTGWRSALNLDSAAESQFWNSSRNRRDFRDAQGSASCQKARRDARGHPRDASRRGWTLSHPTPVPSRRYLNRIRYGWRRATLARSRGFFSHRMWKNESQGQQGGLTRLSGVSAAEYRTAAQYYSRMHAHVSTAQTDKAFSLVSLIHLSFSHLPPLPSEIQSYRVCSLLAVVRRGEVILFYSGKGVNLKSGEAECEREHLSISSRCVNTVRGMKWQIVHVIRFFLILSPFLLLSSHYSSPPYRCRRIEET